MGKVCAVPMCPSGRNADTVRRKRAGIRQASLFSVPKCADILNKWSRAVGKNLTAQDVVCELHFSPNSIKMEYVTTMSDGSVHRMPRDRHDLVTGAVPIALIDKKAANLIDKTPAEMPSQESIHFVRSSTDEQNCTINGLEDHSVLASTLDDDFSNLDEVNVNAPLQNQQQLAAELPPFTIDDVFRYFEETPCRRGWAWLQNPLNENCIVLTQLDPQTMKIRLQLAIDNDLSVTACVSDDMVPVELEGSVTSVQKIISLLDALEKRMVVCSGTGIQDKSRADDCDGLIAAETLRRFAEISRCGDCRKLRETLQKRFKRRKTNVAIRYARCRHASQLKQRQVARLKKKVAYSSTRCLSVRPSASTGKP